MSVLNFLVFNKRIEDLNMKKLIATIALLSFAATVNGQTLTGTWPGGGGNISVTAEGGDVNASGLDFVSPGGNLVPVDGNDATPFQFFLVKFASLLTVKVRGAP